MNLRLCLKKYKIMKTYIPIFIVFFAQFAYAQPFEVLNQTKCYEKYDQRAAANFVENDCENLLGVVDCNEKLDYDAEVNRVFSKNTGKVFSGNCQTCYYSGMRERVINFVDGQEDGEDTTYYETGCVKVVREHNLGKEAGVWKYYFDSTQQIAWQMGFLNGEKHGEHIYYSKKGDTLSQEFFKNGLLHGSRRVYYPKSEIKELANFKDGLMDGDNISYFQNGMKSKHLRYKSGEKQGKQEYLYSNGQMMREENYDKNLKSGQFKAFFIGGEMQTEENWFAGKKHGYFRQYFSNGRIQSEILYDLDKIVLSRRYDEYGALIEGVDPVTGEDDLIPDMTGKRKKSKKPKKEKKPKKPKEVIIIE